MVHLPTADDTFQLGVRLGQRAVPGTVLALIGDLGAGKTLLVRGLASGLGTVSRVQSPTFGLLHTHAEGRLPLFHADWYRLDSPAEAEGSGLFELAADGVLAIEWADRFSELLPDDHLAITLTDAGEGRDAELVAHGTHRGLLDG